MNRFTLPLLVACIALGAWAAWEHIERLKLKAEIEDMELAAVHQTERDKTEQKKLTDKAAKLEAKVVALETAAKESTGESTTVSAKGANDAGRSMADGFARMLSDPKMRDVMKSQARMGIDMIYRDLFDLLNLPEPQRSQFEKLIMEKATVGMETAFAMMGGDKTAEEKKAASAEIKAKTDEFDAKIKELLGQEDYDKVKRYEDSTMERMQLKAFDTMLKGKDLAIDEATEGKLMDIMYQERTKFPFASNFADQQNPDISRFTPENAQRFTDEYTKLNQQITDRAASVLSAPQLEVFKQSQEQQMNTLKMQMEWGARMFGGGDPK